MSGTMPAQRARAILLAVLPDLAAREAAYRVTTTAPDPDLVEALLEQMRAGRPGLRAAAAGRDFASVAQVAHGLKGMGGAVGLPEISVAGAVLEESAKAGLAPAVERMVGALEAWVAACDGAP